MFGMKFQIIIDEVKIDAVLARGVENIFPNKEFLKARLMKGEKLTLYIGVDPTSPTLHLGHLIPLKKLGEFQKLGHQIIFLIGDFTAMIGDPDKTSARKILTRAEVMSNCKSYKDQVSKFIDFSGSNKALLKFNSEWLSQMNFTDTLSLMSNVTYAQIIKRDMFQQRISAGKDLFLHEFMYPLMQGYDSVAMDVDGEVGGNDQTFNMLMGRDLMKKIKNKEKFVIATKLLIDSEGKKMGKTEGNMVSLDQTPEDMFGKVMSWSDGLITPGFELITEVSMHEIQQMQTEMTRGANPKDFKIRLAKEIVVMVHGTDAAEKAQQSFENTFKKGEVPEDIKEVSVANGTLLVDILMQEGIVASKGEFRRLVEGNAVSEIGSDEIIKDANFKIEKSIVLRIGKKRFLKISVE